MDIDEWKLQESVVATYLILVLLGTVLRILMPPTVVGDKSFGLRLRYQCREVGRISKEVAEHQAAGLAETLIE